MLVNNAGMGSVAPLLDATTEKMEDIIALNITALTRLTYAAAPGFVARGTGTIINIASIVGIAPEILNGVYGASKAYVLALSHSLQHELADKGVRIQAVLPGATATDFWEISGRSYQDLPAEIVMSAEDVVDAALVGLEQGELVSIPPLQDGDEWLRWEAARRVDVTELHLICRGGSSNSSRSRTRNSVHVNSVEENIDGKARRKNCAGYWR
jgi:uncharacterized protein